MQQKSNQVQLQLFVCTNKKQNKDCCQDKDSQELRAELRAWIKSEGLNDHVKITASGCLGYCSEGIAMVLHPQNQWLTNVDPSHKDQIKQLIYDQLKSNQEK